MTRRRYLLAYDIADPKRLRRVCRLMQDHGERLQYSVFLCDLSVAEMAELEAAVTAVMHLAHDSVTRVLDRCRELVRLRPTSVTGDLESSVGVLARCGG